MCKVEFDTSSRGLPIQRHSLEFHGNSFLCLLSFFLSFFLSSSGPVWKSGQTHSVGHRLSGALCKVRQRKAGGRAELCQAATVRRTHTLFALNLSHTTQRICHIWVLIKYPYFICKLFQTNPWIMHSRLISYSLLVCCTYCIHAQNPQIKWWNEAELTGGAFIYWFISGISVWWVISSEKPAG